MSSSSMLSKKGVDNLMMQRKGTFFFKRPEMILEKKKYTNLSGGKWVTITKEGSPLHGHHIYINPQGVILAGAVPKDMHGKTLDEVHKMHGDVPHPHMSHSHDDAASKDHEQLKQDVEHAKDQAAKHKVSGADKHATYWDKKADIAAHHMQEKDPNHVIKRPIPDEAPYLSKKPIHNTYSKKTPAELKAIIAQAKENIKSGKGNAYDKKVIAVASYYLNGGQKPDDSAFGPKKGKASEASAEPETQEEEQKTPEPEKSKIDPDAPHQEESGWHDYYSKMSADKLKASQVSSKQSFADAVSEGDDDLHYYKKGLDVINHYAKKQGLDPVELDAKEHAPHQGKYPLTHKAVESGNAADIKAKQDDLVAQMKKYNDQQNKEYYDTAKEKLEVANYYANVNGHPIVHPPKYEKKREVPTFAPHADSSIHLNLSDLDKDALKTAITNAKKVLAVESEHSHTYEYAKKKLEVAQHYLNGGKTPQEYDQIAHEKMLDSFNNPSNQLQTSEYTHTGKDIKDLGVNMKDPNQVHVWNEKIDHTSHGMNGSQIKDLADKMTQMLYHGDDKTGKTNHDSVTAKKKVQTRLGDALMHNEDFLHCALEVTSAWNTLDDYNTPEKRRQLAHDAVRAMIASWAHDSGGTVPLSVAMQQAAIQEFGLKNAVNKFNTGTMQTAKSKYLSKPKVAAGMRAFLREQYNQTQEMFKAQGITHVPILRGMSFPSKDVIQHLKTNEPTKANMFLQPMSSFSSSAHTAENFTGNIMGGGGPYKVIIGAMIPVERIMGTVQTGFGCMNEQEMVVLGNTNGPDDVICYHWYGTKKDEFHNTDMFKFLGDPKFDAQSAGTAIDVSQGEQGKSALANQAAKAKKAPSKTKKATKDYQYKSYSGSYMPAQNAKAVVNEHGVDAFVHKVYNGYMVNDGETGIPITAKHPTQKKAIEVAHWLMDNKLNELKEKLSKHPKIESEKLAKSVNSNVPVLYPDDLPHNANWTKQSPDVDVDGKEIKNSLKKSEDDRGYYPSARHAYKTNTRNPIYLPLNRIQTPYQTDEALDEDKIKENVKRIKNGEALSPVVIGYNYDLHDGHHRLEAAKRVGHSHIPCVVGGRNARRVKAAEARYRAVYKSLTITEDGSLLVKAVAKAGEKWVTIRGNHVLIDGQGNILQGPPHLKGKKLAPKKLDVKSPETKARPKESWEDQKVTPFDTKEIVQARAEAKKQIPTYKRDYFHSPERKKLREEIANKLYGDGAKKKERRIDLVMGPPAAGKSTVLADPLAEKHGALLIDSDMAKELLPEFDGGKGAGVVHEESAQIIEGHGGVFHKALQNGDNIVLPLVGKNADKLLAMRDELNALGYEVHLHLNELPKEKAAQRAVARFYSQGRFVDPDYVYNGVGDKPSEVYEQLKEKGGFHSYEKYSNDVEKGQKPILIEQHGPDAGKGSGRSANGSTSSNASSSKSGDGKEVKKGFIAAAGRLLLRKYS